MRPRVGRPSTANEDRLDERMSYRVTKDEKQKITQQALMKNLSVGNYQRQAVLKRSEDITVEKGMISDLRKAASEIKQLREYCVATGKPPTDDELRAVLIRSVDAISKVGMY